LLSSNAILASLSSDDAAALQPHLKLVDLEQKKVLFEPGGSISTVYFPLTAVISLVVGLSSGEMIEAAMVGRDGVVGATSALDGNISFSLAVVQLSGSAMSCAVGALRALAMRRPSMITVLVRHEQAVYAQAQQSTACMAAHDVQARLCRWLLRARDLSDSDTINFTQEFLAEMLGVRRTSVSPVAHTLQQAGMISFKRGKIRILNAEALEETACECYETVKSHYARLRLPSRTK
jgi:CRP-like cAMP-binding protein